MATRRLLPIRRGGRNDHLIGTIAQYVAIVAIGVFLAILIKGPHLLHEWYVPAHYRQLDESLYHPALRVPGDHHTASLSPAAVRGLDQMGKLRIVMCGLLRGVPSPHLLGHLMGLAHRFRDYRIVIVSDATGETSLKEQLARVSGHVRKRLTVLREPAQVVADTARLNRYARMARLRNVYWYRVRRQLAHMDVVAVVDCDLAGWSVSGVADSFSRWGTWDAVASFGLQHPVTKFWHGDFYDTLALVTTAEARVNSRPHSAFVEATVQLHRQAQAPGAAGWQRVNSAFGGLAVYTRQAFLRKPYDENTRECEHWSFHRGMEIFHNANQLTLYDNNRVDTGSLLEYVTQSFLAW